jgi:hypothetical protein
MKKLLLLLLVIVFLPCFAHAQLTVIDAAVATILETTQIAHIIHYGKMVEDNVTSIMNLVYQVEHLANMVEMYVQNLQSLKDIDSWDDFTSWYNRQLYIEQQTTEAWNGLNVKIGTKDFHITDLEGMAHGVKSDFVDQWGKSLSEDQRREMWLGLGLTPENYAYTQPFREASRKTTQMFMAAGIIQNQKYMSDMQSIHKWQRKLGEDQLISAVGKKMGEKEVLMILADTSIKNLRAVNDTNMLLTDFMKYLGEKEMLDNAPVDKPPISTWWDSDDEDGEKGFLPLN